MVKKVLFVLGWFPLTIALLVANLHLLLSITGQTDSSSEVSFVPYVNISASGYGTEQVLGAHVVAGDSRSLMLQRFLKEHTSPLAPYAEYIVERADYYGLDYRLISSIAMCESNLGKRIPSSDSYNAWGISVESGQITGAKFTSWLTAIDWVSKYMKEKYYARGITNLVDIGAIYAPPSVASGNSWATCVQHFIDQIQ